MLMISFYGLLQASNAIAAPKHLTLAHILVKPIPSTLTSIIPDFSEARFAFYRTKPHRNELAPSHSNSTGS